MKSLVLTCRTIKSHQFVRLRIKESVTRKGSSWKFKSDLGRNSEMTAFSDDRNRFKNIKAN